MSVTSTILGVPNTNNTNTFIQYLNEDLKIVKKNWNLNLPNLPEWTVTINDKLNHNLIDRIDIRTDIGLNKMNIKIQKGLNYISKKIIKNKIQQDVMIGLNYIKSNFIILFLVKPNNKYIRVSTILDKNMNQSGTVKWDINEFNTMTELNYDNNINECSSILNHSILLEPWDNKLEAYYDFDDLLNINE